MSVEAMAIVLHHSAATGTTKLVLLGIANHEGDGGAWPTVSTLAAYANADERTVQRSIARLEELGELRRVVQKGGDHRIPNHKRPNLYQVAVVCPPECDRTTRHRPVDNSAPVRVTPVSPGDASVTPPGDASVTQTIPTNHPNQGLQEERQVRNRASGHRHEFDETSGYCRCGYRDDGSLVDPKTGIRYQPPISREGAAHES